MGKLLLQIELVENCKKLNIFHPRCLCCYNNYGLFFFYKRRISFSNSTISYPVGSSSLHAATIHSSNAQKSLTIAKPMEEE